MARTQVKRVSKADERDTLRVAGYFRISKARDDMVAPEIYQQQLQSYASYKGIELVEVFSDIDFSGRKGAKARPGLEELKARRHEFSAVVTPRLNRFGRSLKDLAELFDLFDSDGISLIFLDVDIDTGSSTGRLVRNILASLAEWEGDRLAESWKATHSHLAKHGRVSGGTNVPFGYRYDLTTKTVQIDKRQAEVVAEIFERFLAGDPLRAITADLNRRGIAPNTRRGAKQWLRQTVAGMVSNPFYAGLREWEGTLREGEWEPIVSRDEWERASSLREILRSDNGQSNSNGARYLLSGLISCGVCGSKAYHVAQRGHRPEMYVCSQGRHFGGTCSGGGIAASRAERIVTDAFFEHLDRPIRQAAKMIKGPKSARADNDDVEQQVARLEQRMGRLLDELSEVPKALAPAIRRKLENLEAERDELRQRSQRAAWIAEQARRSDQAFEELMARRGDIRAMWETTTITDRSVMLRTAAEEVKIVEGRPKRVEVSWRAA